MIGKTVGPYQIVERLGAGGMGVVYRALDPRLGRPVALKFLEHGLVSSANDRERLVREARAASSLDHPNICTIHDFGETGEGEMFIAMACYSGRTLASRIARGPIPLPEALDLLRQITAGLAHAHRAGIVHRDIKLANVLLTDDGTPKITDFGLARAADAPTLTAPGQAVGTLAYMAPEQLSGERGDARSDLWSLGVLGCEMITGSNPFRADTAAATLNRILSGSAPSMPPAVDRIFRRLLARAPGQRYASASELLNDLNRLEGGENDDEQTTRRD